MDKKSLEEKKLSLEQQFNSLQEQIKQNQEECLKLSGEFRLVTNLLENYKETKKNG